MNETIGERISKNTILGILFKVLIMVLSLSSRYVFVLFLSEEYLGINGLYSNILSVLAMADFGINAVMIYILYEPLNNGDTPTLASLVKLFRRIYYLIAGLIMLLGCFMIPFLPWLVTDNFLSITDLIKYYMLFLLNSACSYLGAYKSTLLIADQRSYYVNAIQFASNVARIAAQIGVLYATQNYTLYLLVMIVGTLANNVGLTVFTNKLYPQLNSCNLAVDVSDVKPILYERTKSVFLYRVGGTVVDSTDSILISAMIGTAAVGYYSNYNMIATTVFGLIGVLSQACMTGIGNLSVQATMQEKKTAFYKLLTGYFYVGAVVLCGVLCVTNDFVLIWLRKEKFLLSQSFVAVLAVRLFFDIILSPNWIFRESQGLFDEAKKIRLVAAGVNLVLSVPFGKVWGMTGIIAATTVSKIVSTFWYEPKIICRLVFKEPVWVYWKQWIKMAGLVLCAVVVSCVVASWWDDLIQFAFQRFLVKGLSSTVLVTCIFVISNFKNRKKRH